MQLLPSAIIFVNRDLTDQVKQTIITQLFIDTSMTGYEFDQNVISMPNYVTNIHAQQLRILVIRDFWNPINIDLADVAIFVKTGLAQVIKNKYGPVNQTYQVARININNFIPEEPIYQIPVGGTGSAVIN